MAKISQGSFAQWEFDPKEEVVAGIFTPLQIQFLQNQVSQCADNILNLEYSPNNPLQFVQDDAHNKGQMAILRFLIANSEESEMRLRELQSNQGQQE